jgi:hypothetical protein
LDSYPGGTFTHCSCQPSLDAHFRVLIRINEGIAALSRTPDAPPASVPAAPQCVIAWPPGSCPPPRSNSQAASDDSHAPPAHHPQTRLPALRLMQRIQPPVRRRWPPLHQPPFLEIIQNPHKPARMHPKPLRQLLLRDALRQLHQPSLITLSTLQAQRLG